MSKEELASAMGTSGDQASEPLEARNGLGIPLTRQLIEAHGGTLELASEQGVGTTAIILLP